jgi:hypothetical protein
MLQGFRFPGWGGWEGNRVILEAGSKGGRRMRNDGATLVVLGVWSFVYLFLVRH